MSDASIKAAGAPSRNTGARDAAGPAVSLNGRLRCSANGIRGRLDAGFSVVAVAAVGAMLVLLAWMPAPWFHDAAEWIFQARVLALKWSNPDLVEGYRLAMHPVPNSLAVVLLALLMMMLSPMAAAKLWLALLLLAWLVLGHRWVTRVVPLERRGAVLVVWVAMVALSTFFWYGYLGYQLGLLLLLAFLLGAERRRPAWLVAAWGVVLFFCHAAVALVWGVVVSCQALAELRETPRDGQPERAARLAGLALALAPAGILALWYAAVRLSAPPLAGVDAVTSGVFEALIYKAGFPLMLGAFRNIMRPDGTAVFEDWPWVYWFGVGANVILVAIVGLWAAAAAWRGLRRPTAAGGTGLRWVPPALCVLILVYVLTPYQFFGTVNVSGRLLLPALALAMLGRCAPSYAFWSWAAAAALCGLSVTLLGYALLLAQLPLGQVSHPQAFKPVDAPGDSVFAFNAALYSGSRYRYFNYRVLLGSERFEQMQRGEYRGLGFRTGLLLDWRQPDPAR